MDSEIHRLMDIEEIKQLKARYFRHLDLKEWGAWSDVFTEDVHTEADGFPFDGRDAFIGALSQILDGVRTVHQGFTPEITLTGPDAAEGTWGMRDHLVFPGRGTDGGQVGFVGYGHYHETYLRQDGRWRIHTLLLTRIGIDPLPGGLPGQIPA